ncbi:MAG: BON domain-containing protein [Burkholderiaceae bacterium]|nr:BON domain-containing protein [Burkholderiaceae bacterium]
MNYLSRLTHRCAPGAVATLGLVGLLGLSACDGDPITTASNGLGQAVAEVAAEVASGVANDGQDAVISAWVLTELALHPQLGSMKIHVDTRNGRVLLHGSVPSRAARDQAGALAASIDGVAAVDNQLKIHG